MYLPLARSASKLARAFSSSPTLAGVPIRQTDTTLLWEFCARAGPVLMSKPKENIVGRTSFTFPPQVANVADRGKEADTTCGSTRQQKTDCRVPLILHRIRRQSLLPFFAAGGKKPAQ